MPVCSNCGGSDFVWAENLKTGGFGRSGLSLRAGGELALGTRVCRGCGHADLFVKDPTVLRQPHTWKPGEFVPISPKGPTPSRPATPSATSSSPGPAAPAVPPMSALASPATSPAAARASSAPPSSASPAVEVPPPTSSGRPAEPEVVAPGAPDAPAKKPPRRRAAKPKAANPPVLQE